MQLLPFQCNQGLKKWHIKCYKEWNLTLFYEPKFLITPSHIIILSFKYLHNKSVFINMVWQRKEFFLYFFVKKGNILYCLNDKANCIFFKHLIIHLIAHFFFCFYAAWLSNITVVNQLIIQILEVWYWVFLL